MKKKFVKYSFNDVAKEMTKVDAGGVAGKQLDITEARQALSCFLLFASKHMTLENVAVLITEAINTRQPKTEPKVETELTQPVVETE
jgi:hypothetical protein